MSELIITNGDSAADLLASAGLQGRMLPWRDVLHEGPLVPATGLTALSDVRAAYLSERFDLPSAEAKADFIARDSVITAHRMFDRVSIWLEHDLYDQLQLLQILHFFHHERRTEGLFLIQADDFIATQTPDSVLRFGQRPIAVSPSMLSIAANTWDAVCAPTPEALIPQLRITAGIFRFLPLALQRFLEELPSVAGGLPRSARVMMAGIAGGKATPRDIFGRLLASEEAAFMGDWSAYRILDDLAFAPEPLITGLTAMFPCRGSPPSVEEYLSSPLALTAFGRLVLDGAADIIAMNGIDRWWGGTHMTGHDTWRWDSKARALVSPGATRPARPTMESRND